MPTKIYK